MNLLYMVRLVDLQQLYEEDDVIAKEEQKRLRYQALRRGFSLRAATMRPQSFSAPGLRSIPTLRERLNVPASVPREIPELDDEESISDYEGGGGGSRRRN